MERENSNRYGEMKSVEKKSKIPYLNLVLVIVSIISFYVGVIFLGKSIEIVFVLITFVSLLFVFTSSIFLMTKKYKGALLYITFVISIICGVFSAIMLFSRISAIIDKTKYNNSDESKIDILENLEDKLSDEVADLADEGLLIRPLNEKGAYVLIDKKHYEAAIPVWNEKGYRTKESVYNKEEFEGYNCDGYTEVKKDYEGYEKCSLDEDAWCDYYLDFYTAKSYITCTGKYTYKTEGFDENKFKESKSEDYYNNHNMKN